MKSFQITFFEDRNGDIAAALTLPGGKTLPAVHFPPVRPFHLGFALISAETVVRGLVAALGAAGAIESIFGRAK